jgi:hypothetical protein
MSDNEIKLIKSDKHTEGKTDLDLMEKFYDFLRGQDKKNGTYYNIKNAPKLSDGKAFSVIWYLQEILPVLGDHIEQCWNCKNLFDTREGGLYWKSKGRHYCDGCEYLVPENYDNCKRS